MKNYYNSIIKSRIFFRVPQQTSGLRIKCCPCCGVGSIPGPETSAYCRHNQKKKKKDNSIYKMGKGFEQSRSSQLQGRHTNSHKCTESSSTALAIREMQTKTTMGYHFTLTRMAIEKKKRCTITWDGKDWEKTYLIHCWQEWKIVQSLWKQFSSSLNG